MTATATGGLGIATAHGTGHGITVVGGSGTGRGLFLNGGTLTINSTPAIPANSANVSMVAAGVVATANSRIVVGSAPFTALTNTPNNFYPANSTTGGTAVANVTYYWNDNAGGTDTAGWKQVIPYTAPAPQTINGVTATVTFGTASPRVPGTSINAHVTLTGTAVEAGDFTIDLTSTKAGLTSDERTITVVAGEDISLRETAERRATFQFTIPPVIQTIDDFILTFAHPAGSGLPCFPETGIPGVMGYVIAMFAFLAASVVLWGFILRRKLKKE